MSTRHQWSWKSFTSSHSSSNTRQEWHKFSDIEMSIIEDAYQKLQGQVELDDGIIYLKHFILINKLKPTEARSVRRITCESGRRDERFNRHDFQAVESSILPEENKPQHPDSDEKTESQQCMTTGQIDPDDTSIQLKINDDESHVNSCPPVTLECLIEDENIISSFSSDQLTILSGSASGLASIGLQNLVKRYTNISLPDDDKLAWDIIEPHFSKGPPRIRLETVFEIIQQYIDPNLSLLDVLMTDTPTFNRSHYLLAMLAMKYTVITTNFDHLIEDAGRFQLGNDPNVIPFNVFCTEEHFKKAYDSINNGLSPDLTGLWKIHGTVAIWQNQQRVLVRADQDGGPIATLKRLSLTRESTERRRFLHYLLETRPLIIINYSATDDFDVTRWLKTVKTPMNVLWIQRIDESLEPIFWNGIDIVNGTPSNTDSFDRGLIAIATVWHERGIANCLQVVTTADPVSFLCQITRLSDSIGVDNNDNIDSNTDYTVSLPTRWQSYIVSGAMLSHLSYFAEAKRYFDYVTDISIEGTREYCIARLAAAEASIEVGDRNGRIQAMNDAFDTAEAAPLSLSSWSDRKAKFIAAKVKRFVEKDGLATAIVELEQLLNECGNPENKSLGQERNVALDAAILLAQLRRYLPSSPEPSNIAKQWIESIPKLGLLHTKGLNLHESALNKYQVATNIQELDDAIYVMKEAIEIREELGHMRGLVASLNVLGSMQMRRADWALPFDITNIKYAAEQFRHSIEYSDKHAAVFDQFQARIHLAVCLLRYPSVSDSADELQEILDYFKTRITDDLRTQIESEFCLAMAIFANLTLSAEEMCNQSEQLFNELTIKHLSNNDARLIRILAAARFNAELCQDWRRGQAHTSNHELTRDIVTRKTVASKSVYWQMRIERAETQIPSTIYDRLQLLLDPISP